MLCATGLLPSSFYVISFVLLWAMMCAFTPETVSFNITHNVVYYLDYWESISVVSTHAILAINIEHCIKRFVIRQPLKSLRAASFSTLQAMLPIGSYFQPCFSCPPVCLHTYHHACTLKIGVPTPQQFIRSWFSISLSSHSLKSKAESLAERI